MRPSKSPKLSGTEQTAEIWKQLRWFWRPFLNAKTKGEASRIWYIWARHFDGLVETKILTDFGFGGFLKEFRISQKIQKKPKKREIWTFWSIINYFKMPPNSNSLFLQGRWNGALKNKWRKQVFTYGNVDFWRLLRYRPNGRVNFGKKISTVSCWPQDS